MQLRLDASARSVVVLCSACPPWRAMAANKRAGWLLAADHARRVHGKPRHADTLTGKANALKTGG